MMELRVDAPARIMAGKENDGRFPANCSIASSLLSSGCCRASSVIVEDSTASLQRENTHLEMHDEDPTHVAIPKKGFGFKDTWKVFLWIVRDEDHLFHNSRTKMHAQRTSKRGIHRWRKTKNES